MAPEPRLPKPTVDPDRPEGARLAKTLTRCVTNGSVISAKDHKLDSVVATAQLRRQARRPGNKCSNRCGPSKLRVPHSDMGFGLKHCARCLQSRAPHIIREEFHDITFFESAPRPQAAERLRDSWDGNPVYRKPPRMSQMEMETRDAS